MSRKITLLAAIAALMLTAAAPALARHWGADDSAKGNSAKNKGSGKQRELGA